MLIVDGYKMAEGTATIRFLGHPDAEVEGVWLYRPDIDRWTVAPCAAFPWGGTFTREEIVQIKEREVKG